MTSTKAKIGWLHDRIGIIGGSELSEAHLRRAAPEWVEEIVLCPPNRRPPSDIDLWILQNTITYGDRWIPVLEKKPVIKQIRDFWWAGSPVFRRWVLDNVQLLTFSSPTHEQHFVPAYNETVRVEVIPPPLDLEPFRAASLPIEERQSAVFLGRIEPGKGAHHAVDWALRNEEPLDLYGNDRMKYIPWTEVAGLVRHFSRVPYAKIPDILGRAKQLVFMPDVVEAFGRIVPEAWAAGCDLVLDMEEEKIGSWYWISERPEDIERGAEMFWQAVEEVAW